MNKLLLVAGVYVCYKLFQSVSDYFKAERHEEDVVDWGINSSARRTTDDGNNSFGSTNGVYQDSNSFQLLSSSSSSNPSSSSPNPATSPSNFSQSFSEPLSYFSSPSLSSTKALPSYSNLSQNSSPIPTTSSSKQSALYLKPATSNLSQSFFEPPSSSSSPSLSSTKAPPLSSILPQKSSPTPATFSSKQSSSSPKPATSNLFQSFCEPSSSSSSPSLSSTKTPPLYSNLSQNSSHTPTTSSSKQSSSYLKPATSNLSQSFSEPLSSSSSPSLSSTKAPPSFSNLSQKSDLTSATVSSKQSSSSPKPATSNLFQSFSEPSSSSSSPSLSSTNAPPSYSNLSQNSSPPPATSSSKQSSSPPKPATSNLSQSFSEPTSSSSSPSLSSTNTPPSSSNLSQKSSPTPATFSSKQSSSSPKPATSNLFQSFFEPSSSSSKPSLSSTKAPPSSSNLSQKSSPTPATFSSKQSSSPPKLATSNRFQLFSEPSSSSSSPSLSLPSSPNLSQKSYPEPTSFKPSPSSSGPNPPPSFKTILSQASFDLDDQHMIWLEKSTSPTYKIPKDIEDLIKKDFVPKVLEMPLSPSTYKDYFSALLFAEDFYVKKWCDFKLENVTLELQKGAIYKKSVKNRYNNECDERVDKIFVAFEIENVPEKRPFLQSRDFVFARPSDSGVEPFQGILHCVVNSTRVLVEFANNFHSQHYSTRKYDVSFSFNRVCLKRAHQAIAAASDSVFRNFIFPNNLSRKNNPTSPHHLSCYHKLDQDQKSAVFRILSFQGPPPYLVHGPLCVEKTVSYSKELSRTGLVVREAVLQICRRSPESRILICAPLNNTCDVLTKSLNQEIPASDMFRANAAFREIDGIPIDILPSCTYKGECFVCPPLQKLKKFKVILSTFISSFRLHEEGITAGDFTDIFLVDASSATEPEAMVALSNFADEKTAVVVTGAPGNRSGWVRSDIARWYGLRMSYFERLCESNPYSSLDPSFISQLGDY